MAVHRTGRPPLTERRKAATRLEIAREAVALFTDRGVAATSADEIAAAAGISVRTLWRYFPNKESSVLPLLTGGIEATARALRSWPAGSGMAALLDDLVSQGQETITDLPALLNLVRLTRTEAGLRAVWLQSHHDAEPVFATALAQRAGLPDDDPTVRIQAAMINSALRAAVEHYAFRTDTANQEELTASVRMAMATVARGLPD
ncbi:TetR/AcrR family transcriptional regulator [Phytohabitans aurantiacus]|jgi:AcrR family transcriptional regulator|nr:TetR/AcrR family transcriptional regulator [Phytohabitans aurantiacus]